MSAEPVDNGSHLLDDVVHLRQIGRIERYQPKLRLLAFAVDRVDRIIPKLRVFHQMPDNVDPEAVDAAPQPKTHHIVDRRANLGVAPVQVRLLAQECVVVILRRRLVEFPGTAAEFRKPIVRRPPSGPGSRQMYQLRFGLSRDERLSMNQGCWSEVWLGTRSSRTFNPRPCAAASSSSNSPKLPNNGSISV